MQTLRTQARTDDGGILHFDLPIGEANSDYEVVIVFQLKLAPALRETPEDRGWSAVFAKDVLGSWEGDFIRDHPGFEDRDW